MAAMHRVAPVKNLVVDIHKCEICKKFLHDRPSYIAHMKSHTDGCPYACDLCPYKCKVKKYLSRHKKKVHTKANGPECPVCGKIFHFNHGLRNHLRVHTGERPFACEVCKKTFSSSYCLSVHRLIHTDEKPFECKFCDYACRDSSTLRKHQERHMGISKMFPCQKCKKTFKSKTVLQSHVDEVHFGVEMRRIPCEICDKMFKTNSAVRMHIKTVHERSDRIACEICDRLVSKNNLNVHLKSHVDIRPYKCTFENCGKLFKNKCALQKHSVIHYPERHYQCEFCDSKFSRMVRMKKHMLQHVSNGYTCDHCGGSFSNKTFLKIHLTKKHGRKSEKFICDECGSTHFSKRSIIIHIRYGHGHRYERNCRVCGDLLQNNSFLSEHYLKVHKVKYVVMDQQEVTIKQENEEVDLSEQFDINYDVQKIEVEEHIPNFEDPSKSVTYTKSMLEVDLSKSIISADVSERTFDDFYRRALSRSKSKEYIPVYADVETTLAYSEKVLEEDISRSVAEREKVAPAKCFGNFFLNQNINISMKDIAGKVDKTKLNSIQKTVDKMLNKSRVRKMLADLEKMRQEYNRRIHMACRSKEKKETTQIKYFQKPQNIEDSTKSDDKDDHRNKFDDDLSQGDKEPSPRQENDDDCNDASQNSDTASQIDESNANEGNDNEDMKNDDESKPARTKRIKTVMRDDDYDANDDGNRNGKLRFDGHECYICFKVFKTKNDLKLHCREHFDICNDKMLKKCPFCGYVTNLDIIRHIRLVHKIYMRYPYAHITEKQNANGSKYVFEIDKDCELEIIPSISNLNKMACMKLDRVNRKNNNLFVGKTKLVKKGAEWVVVREAVGITTDNILPEFTEDEYSKLKITGTSYFDGLKLLSIMAKSHGIKMLFPCEGCEKICQTLSALTLHNRKHELNPKQFKPKVWVNRIVKPKTPKKGKKGRPKTKNQTTDKSRHIPVKATNKLRRELKTNTLEHRYASPQPVKNNHKCDKKLIEFYNSNIRGKDIEFWQFLKIFNKMNRENVNDFDDLVNRDDVHFGLHTKDECVTPVNSSNKPVTNRDEPVTNRNEPGTDWNESVTNWNATATVNTKEEFISEENEPVKKIPVISKNIKKIRSMNNKSPRVIVISKKENMKRNEIKNQMRQRLAQIASKA